MLDDVESDDGDGGQINLSLAVDLPAVMGSSQAAVPVCGAGGRGVKRLVPDKEQDEIMNEIFRELVPRKRRRKRKRKVMARGGLQLPPDVEALLGEANTEYAYGNFDQAREKLLEVVRICPSCPDAYTTLGLIHDERQEAAKALDFLIIAAHLTPKDAEMWADLAQRSRVQGKLKQAIYCLNRAIKIEPGVDELLWDKAQLLQETSQHRRAIEVLAALIKKIDVRNYGKVMEASLELARQMHQHNNDTAGAIKVLEDWLKARDKFHAWQQQQQHAAEPGKKGKGAKDGRSLPVKMTVHELGGLNMLVECLLLLKEPERALGHLTKAIEALPKGEKAPVDIAVKVAVCLILLNKVDAAHKPLEQLWALSIEKYGDLYLDVAEAYRQAAQPPPLPPGWEAEGRRREEPAAALAARRAMLVRAVQLYRQLVDVPLYDKDAVWLWQVCVRRACNT